VYNGTVIWDAPKLPAKNTTVGFSGGGLINQQGTVTLRNIDNTSVWKAQSGDGSNGVQLIPV